MSFLDFFTEIGYALASISKGLWVTFVNFLRPKITLQYPDVRPRLASRFRGFPIVDLETCIGCLACEKICPNQLIHIERSPSEVKGKWKVDRFDLDYSLCMLCNLCEDVCPTHPEPDKRAISLQPAGGYELAHFDRAQLQWGILSRDLMVVPPSFFREVSAGTSVVKAPPPERPRKEPAHGEGEARAHSREGRVVERPVQREERATPAEEGTGG